MEPYLARGLEIVAATVLALMCYQDWRARSISWPAFPVLGGALLALRLLHEPVALVGLHLAINMGLVAALVAALWLYVRLRFHSLALRDCLGSGDVLYWAVVAVYFSPDAFLVYFLSSSVAALLVAGLAQRYRAPAPDAYRVPLAGIQAGCLLLLLGLQAALPTWAARVVNENLLTALTR